MRFNRMYIVNVLSFLVINITGGRILDNTHQRTVIPIINKHELSFLDIKIISDGIKDITIF